MRILTVIATAIAIVTVSVMIIITLPPFRPNVVSRPGATGPAGIWDAENAPAPTSAEIDSAKTAGKVSAYARGIMPSSALITIDAMPTGIMTFHPMFMSWS
jgi:hypothetical protein